MNELSEQLKAIIATILECEQTQIEETSGLATHPGWDSLRHVIIIVEVEKVFNVNICDEEIEVLVDFRLLLDYLNTKTR